MWRLFSVQRFVLDCQEPCQPCQPCAPCCPDDAPQRTFLVVANWRMHGSRAQICELIKCIRRVKIRDKQLVLAPPCLYLELAQRTAGNCMCIAAQNCYCPDKGPYTGEISPVMLKDMGIEWVILGYSDRRYTFCESDELIASKAAYALCCGIQVVLCVSDTLKDCKEGKTMEAVFRQLKAVACKIVSKHHWHRVVIAYEPIWACGMCKPPDAQQVQDILSCIRSNFAKCISPEAADCIRIIYGGYVSGDNCDDYAVMPDIDGFLINEYVLKPGFNEILHVCPCP